VLVPAGKGEITTQPSDVFLRFVNATEILMLVTLDAGKAQHVPADICQSKMAAVSSRPCEEIRNEHCLEHSNMFDRVELRIEDPVQHPQQDTTALVARAVAGEYDNALAEQVFQMGRYLMMSCNRAGRRTRTFRESGANVPIRSGMRIGIST